MVLESCLLGNNPDISQKVGEIFWQGTSLLRIKKTDADAIALTGLDVPTIFMMLELSFANSPTDLVHLKIAHGNWLYTFCIRADEIPRTNKPAWNYHRVCIWLEHGGKGNINSVDIMDGTIHVPLLPETIALSIPGKRVCDVIAGEIFGKWTAPIVDVTENPTVPNESILVLEGDEAPLSMHEIFKSYRPQMS